MATVQVDGSTPVTSTSTVNNGGVSKTSSLRTTTYTAMKTISGPVEDVGVGSNVVVDGTDADKAVSGDTFANFTDTPSSPLLTSTLNGGAPGDIANPAYIKTNRVRRDTLAQRGGQWDEVNGVWASGYPVVNADDWVSPTGGASASQTDKAGTADRADQGAVVYLTKPVPTATNYDAKTG